MRRERHNSSGDEMKVLVTVSKTKEQQAFEPCRIYRPANLIYRGLLIMVQFSHLSLGNRCHL